MANTRHTGEDCAGEVEIKKPGDLGSVGDIESVVVESEENGCDYQSNNVGAVFDDTISTNSEEQEKWRTGRLDLDGEIARMHIGYARNKRENSGNSGFIDPF